MQENTFDGERIVRERAEAERARQLVEAAQPALFVPKKTTMKNHPYRLCAGDLVRIQPKPALVRISPQSEIPILNR